MRGVSTGEDVSEVDELNEVARLCMLRDLESLALSNESLVTYKERTTGLHLENWSRRQDIVSLQEICCKIQRPTKLNTISKDQGWSKRKQVEFLIKT